MKKNVLLFLALAAGLTVRAELDKAILMDEAKLIEVIRKLTPLTMIRSPPAKTSAGAVRKQPSRRWLRCCRATRRTCATQRATGWR